MHNGPQVTNSLHLNNLLSYSNPSPSPHGCCRILLNFFIPCCHRNGTWLGVAGMNWEGSVLSLVRTGVKIWFFAKESLKNLWFIVHSYKNIKARMGTTAGRGQFRVTGQDRIWVLSVKAGSAATGSDGKGWSREAAGDRDASHNCRLNSVFWLKLGLEFDPHPGFKRAEESNDCWIEGMRWVRLQTTLAGVINSLFRLGDC